MEYIFLCGEYWRDTEETHVHRCRPCPEDPSKTISQDRPVSARLPLPCCSRSNNALCHHSLGDLDESCDIGTFHIIDVAVGFSTIFYAVGMYIIHNLV